MILERVVGAVSGIAGSPRAGPDPSGVQIFRFNEQREALVSETIERVVREVTTGSVPVDVVLNECAAAEIKRLQARGSDGTELEQWHRLTRRLARLDEQARVGELRGVVAAMARDIAGSFDPRVYEFARRIVPAIIAGTMRPRAAITTLLDVERSEIRRLVRSTGDFALLGRLARRGTLVFVPTHSSNLDSLVLGETLDRHALPPVVYGAGKNLFTNPVISFFMHNLGAYRVDRTVQAKLYKGVLKTWSTLLLERGFHSLFFPGGTRSRSGQIEAQLKLGLLGTALDAFNRTCVQGRPRRIYLVPVTLNYAVVLEAMTLIDDYLKDRGKARYIIDDDEFSRLDRWVRLFSRLAGFDSAVIVRAGRPLDPFGNPVDDEGRSLGPKGQQLDPEHYVHHRGEPVFDAARNAAYTRELGRRLAAAFRRDTVAVSTQVVCFVLLRRLIEQTPGLDLIARARLRAPLRVARAHLLAAIDELRAKLARLVARGELHASPWVADADADAMVDRALRAFRYHLDQAPYLAGGEIVAPSAGLILYYGSRLLPWARELATSEPAWVTDELVAIGAGR